MRSAAPAGISLLNYLGKRGLARLEPSWSATLFCWRFSGISKIVCILCIAAAIFNRNSRPIRGMARIGRIPEASCLQGCRNRASTEARNPAERQ